nr:hypothetical protein [Kibdelosporangium sp. MJ126-NF4]
MLQGWPGSPVGRSAPMAAPGWDAAQALPVVLLQIYRVQAVVVLGVVAMPLTLPGVPVGRVALGRAVVGQEVPLACL